MVSSLNFISYKLTFSSVESSIATPRLYGCIESLCFCLFNLLALVGLDSDMKFISFFLVYFLFCLLKRVLALPSHCQPLLLCGVGAHSCRNSYHFMLTVTDRWLDNTERRFLGTFEVKDMKVSCMMGEKGHFKH